MALGGFLATKNGGKTKKHLASVQGLRELFLFASLMIKTKVWVQESQRSMET